MEEIIAEYESLFKKLNEKGKDFTEHEMAVFNARKGLAYKNQLMVVGRAVNGWIYKFTKDKYGDIGNVLPQISKDLLAEHDLMDVKYKASTYNPNRSSFSKVKQILAAKITHGVNNVANNAIVWSNLYKISRWSGLNPSTGLKRVQFDHCRNILKYEIDFYKPNVIIFLTGNDWAKPFLDHLGIKNELPITSSMKYVRFIGKYQNSYVVVGQHPQAKKRAPHVVEIMEALGLLNYYSELNGIKD